jgi:hypothetical protein
MVKPPAWVRPLINQINWSKHFGAYWPDTLCDSHSPDWDREQFLEQVDFEGLVSIASSLRNGMSCEIAEEYLGMYNCIYYLVFEDKTQWIARIPLLFRQFESDDEEAEQVVQQELFKSMIASQTFARRKKGVFAPTIYASFVDGNNPVGAPFILMQTIVGWRTDENIGHMPLESLRPVFSDIAREMVSLASPPYFNKIGSLFQNGEEYEVGPLFSQPSLQDEPIDMNKRGPFSTIEDYFVTALNRHIANALRDQNRSLYIQSTRLRALLPQFIDPRFNEGPFILSPFDWDARDIFFQNRAVNGILDWDFATVAPLQSYFRYPPFMTRDWINGTKSSVMEHYRRTFRECLAELQDETELPLLELLDQSRWFQMLDEGVQSSEAGKLALPVLEAYAAAASNRKFEVNPIPVIKAMPVLKDIKSGGSKAQ